MGDFFHGGGGGKCNISKAIVPPKPYEEYRMLGEIMTILFKIFNVHLQFALLQLL